MRAVAVLDGMAWSHILPSVRIEIQKDERDVLKEHVQTLFSYAGEQPGQTDPHWLFLARTRAELADHSPRWFLDGSRSSIAALISGEECAALRERVGDELTRPV